MTHCHLKWHELCGQQDTWAGGDARARPPVLPEGDVASLLAFRSRVEVLVPFTRDVARIRQAKRYAAATGGLFFDIEHPARIAEALRAIESDLRSQYRIVYHSSSEGRELRRVEVELAGRRHERVRARTAYYP